MLEVVIPEIEVFDEESNRFFSIKSQKLQLEHSLVSLSKWESKWNKVFLSREPKTLAETRDYIQCMTITQNVDPRVYNYISGKVIDAVSQYIELPMTATTFATDNIGRINREIITAEIIYYWMITFNVPFDPCQKWHLNRLLTLIKVCNIKNQPKKKMSQKEIYERNRALNTARREQMKSSG